MMITQRSEWRLKDQKALKGKETRTEVSWALQAAGGTSWSSSAPIPQTQPQNSFRCEQKQTDCVYMCTGRRLERQTEEFVKSSVVFHCERLKDRQKDQRLLPLLEGVSVSLWGFRLKCDTHTGDFIKIPVSKRLCCYHTFMKKSVMLSPVFLCVLLVWTLKLFSPQCFYSALWKWNIWNH